MNNNISFWGLFALIASLHFANIFMHYEYHKNTRTTITEYVDSTYFKFDYTMELDYNNIYITTKQGDTHIIHADSLEEFIEKDNL